MPGAYMISFQSNTEDEKVIDSVRPLLLAKDLGAKTYGEYRTHMRRSGISIDHWPEFARTSTEDLHVTKAGFAILLLTEFDKSRTEALERTSVALPPVMPHPEKDSVWTKPEQDAIQAHAHRAVKQAEVVCKISLNYWRSLATMLKQQLQQKTDEQRHT